MGDKPPKYELRAASRDEVVELFEKFHGYKSLSASMTYCFAVFEDSTPIAAYAWQPPPPGAAKSVCPEAPQAVLSLSRMVAVGKESRRLKHISKPLRRQMNHMIDRTRWRAGRFSSRILTRAKGTAVSSTSALVGPRPLAASVRST